MMKLSRGTCLSMLFVLYPFHINTNNRNQFIVYLSTVKSTPVCVFFSFALLMIMIPGHAPLWSQHISPSSKCQLGVPSSSS